MIKRIGVTEAGTQFPKFVDGVHLQGDVVILPKRGQPTAAMVPISLYGKWQEQRCDRLTVFQSARAEGSNSPINDDVLMAELEKIKHEVRQMESK